MLPPIDITRGCKPPLPLSSFHSHVTNPPPTQSCVDKSAQICVNRWTKKRPDHPMTSAPSRNRVLDPLERFSEIVFGLIMVLSFTCALSVATATRDDVQAMFVAAIGCNLAWGIVDAAFYLISCLTERARDFHLLRQVQAAADPDQARAAITEALPDKVVQALDPGAFGRIQAHLQSLPAPPPHPRLTPANWRGAIGVFFLVFLSTFPVVFPFALITDPFAALRTSNAVAVLLLFGAGYMLARYAGLRPVPIAFSIVTIGFILVSITIALGG